MAGYKLATYQSADGPRAGLVIDDNVFDAAKLTGKPAYSTVLNIITDWSAAKAVLKEAAAKAGKGRVKGQPLGKTKLRAPAAVALYDLLRRLELRRPRRRDGPKSNRPIEPDPHTLGLKAWHFIKAARSVTDPGATVKISNVSEKVDWEVELAAVIGRPARNVPESKALSYVAGYMCANDLSARDRGPRPNLARQFAVQGRLDQAQELRRLLPAGPLDRAGERHPRPAEPGHEAVGQRRPEAGFQHQADDLQPGRTDRPTVQRHDASSRRRHPDRHARRRRRRAGANSSRRATW